MSNTSSPESSGVVVTTWGPVSPRVLPDHWRGRLLGRSFILDRSWVLCRGWVRHKSWVLGVGKSWLRDSRIRNRGRLHKGRISTRFGLWLWAFFDCILWLWRLHTWLRCWGFLAGNSGSGFLCLFLIVNSWRRLFSSWLWFRSFSFGF